MKKTEMKKQEMAKKMYRMNGGSSEKGGGMKPKLHGSNSGHGKGESPTMVGKGSGSGKGQKVDMTDTQKSKGNKAVYDQNGQGSNRAGGMPYKQAC